MTEDPPIVSPLSPKPPDEVQRSLEDYSCGWYKDRLLIPGRLYIYKTHVTFQPQFGQHPVTIKCEDIIGLYKKNTAYVFPNAIEIATKAQKYFFGSFYFRDQAFATLQSLLPNQADGDHGDPSELDEESRARSRASSASDDEELKPLAATKAAGQKALAAMKRTMTKSSSQPAIERSNTPPPTFVPFSPQPSSSISANTSPAVSPAPRRRDEVPSMALNPDQEHSFSDGGDEIDRTFSSETHDSVDHDSPNSHPSTDHSISPLHSPSNEDELDNEVRATTQAHENGYIDHAQEAAEHALPSQEGSHFDVPTLSIHSPTPPPVGTSPPPTSVSPAPSAPSALATLSTSPPPTSAIVNPATATTATPAATPNSTPNRAKQPEPEKQKLPPIVEQCEHMTYPPFSDSFSPFIEETLPCPLQDFYRLIISSNFWSEVNDQMGYTDATTTPWLTRNSNSGPCCIYRQLNFRMDINGKIGPKSTRVQQTQRCRLKNSQELLVETSSVSLDVPYADSFTTDSSLIIKSTSGGASCNIRVASRVNFMKATWGFGGIIEKNAMQGSKDFFNSWITIVRAKIDKEYTKAKAPAQPQKVTSPQLQAGSHSPQGNKSPLSRSHPVPHSSHHPTSPLAHSSTAQHSHPVHKQVPPAASAKAAAPSSAFTPVAPKKFWPNVQHQLSTMPMPVAILFVVVLLMITIAFPYTLYLRARVVYAEGQLIEFNNAVGRIENKISFMQLYINYLKEHPNSNVPPSSATPKDDLKAELMGLAHLLDVASNLEARMEDWQHQLDSAGKTLHSTQDLVGNLREDIGNVLMKREKGSASVRGGGANFGGWVYFIVGTTATLLVVAGSLYYFRESLPLNKIKLH